MLDVGAGSGIDRPDWMHAAVASVATTTVGVELDAKLAARARERGYDVVAADAQTLDLGRTFDVVWAGELIEHLSCAGGFLDAAHRHLEPDGRSCSPPRTRSRFRTSSTGSVAGPGSTRGTPAGTTRPRFRSCCAGMDTTSRRCRICRIDTPGRMRAVIAGAVRFVLPRHLAENTLLVVATKA